MKVNYEDGNRHSIGKKNHRNKSTDKFILVCINTAEFSKTETISKAVITVYYKCDVITMSSPGT